MSAIGDDYRPPADEIRYNLGIMRNTVDNGGVVDPGFLDIFRDAIAALPAQEQQSLSLELGRISTKLSANFNSIFDRVDKTAKLAAFNPGSNPLIAPISRLSTMADEYQNLDNCEHIIQALNQLDADFDCRRIRGDGHCLFRAIGAGLLESCQHMSAKQKEEKIALINEEINRLVGNQPRHRLHALKGTVANAIRSITPETRDAAIMNGRTSHAMVEFLRALAVEGIQRRPNADLAVLDQELIGRRLSRQDYFRGMTRVDLAWEGGPQEMFSIANSLGIELKVHDTTILASSSYVNTYGPQTPIGGQPVDLLYRPGHYDLLIQRQP